MVLPRAKRVCLQPMLEMLFVANMLSMLHSKIDCTLIPRNCDLPSRLVL